MNLFGRAVSYFQMPKKNRYSSSPSRRRGHPVSYSCCRIDWYNTRTLSVSTTPGQRLWSFSLRTGPRISTLESL